MAGERGTGWPRSDPPIRACSPYIETHKNIYTV